MTSLASSTSIRAYLRHCLTPVLLSFLLCACDGAGQPPPPADESLALPFDGIDLAELLDCTRENRATLLQAHRAGGRPGAAENSIAAIEASLADGALFLEIDVTRAADGVLILMHDDTLDRTTTGTGPVASRTHAELSRLTLVDAAGTDTGEPVPALDAALGMLAGRGIAQIDRKRSVSFDEIATAVEANDATDRVVIITYTVEEAIAVHKRLPQVMISTGIGSPDDVAKLREAGVDMSRISAWLGLGSGEPELDAVLARLGIETSYGDFRAERSGAADYRAMADNGAEVLSVDRVAEAARALNAPEELQRLMQSCDL